MTTPPQQQPMQQNPYAQQGPNPYAQAAPPPQQPAHPQQGVPAQGHPQWGHQQWGHPNQQAAHAGCRFCGGAPVANVTFRAHQGLLILMRFQKFDGLMCAACGEAVYRETTGKTLWQGWWSPFSLVFFTPFTLLWNLFARRKVKALQPPVPGQHGPQVPAGVPLHRRPLSYVGLLPVLWIAFVIISGVFFGDPLAE
ncbi:hypothetical protein [Streptomyces indicus]|uniref:Uncharacterized protein n=1 Tax=Streptomyces indicus TaxID=417292 RepID=A0A1G9DIJ6_9ACTN|nr:hypothetical protein [Streptomyces indicus]SDK63742.1 hypothetical protein SAMN05421806_109259 [Streptomyces indicus]